ncbi:FAD-binding oxidoreductase [Sphingobium aromaticivastans]|uniref:FAD-binding oxidoreductase n=1 Tax=Sphingobium aromaticivastans TaxID=1778665 RepID=UPI003017021B
MDLLYRALTDAIGPQAVSHDDALRELVSQDIFYRTDPVAMVVRPATADDVARTVRLVRDHGAHLVVRGGGMSYSAGYLSDAPDRAVLLDMRGLDRVVEINAQDMYVVVQPGCTWAALHAVLDPLGLRTPYWGTLSGRMATVGGGIGQNAIFWGAGAAGSAADSVIGLEVVTGDGALVRTGSYGVANSNGFCRHFGPDLTGLFTADAGAMGVKTAIVLRLERKPALSEGLSFLLPDNAALTGFMADVARSKLAAQQMALDDGLKTARLASGSWRDMAAVAWQVLRSAPNPVAGAVSVGRMGLAGKGVLDGMPYSAHIFIEAGGRAALAEHRAAVRELAASHGAREVTASVPQAMLAEPFPALNGVTGPKGQRWVPVHCVLPLSRADAGLAALDGVFARHAAAMADHGITLSWLFTTIANHAFVIEPMFFWPDALEALHRHAIGEKRAGRFGDASPVPEARALIARIRRDAVEAVDALGALHIQLGGFYPYRSRLGPDTLALLDAVSARLDPQSVINPQVLRD